ncbi:MAG: hypothetical protein Q8861_03215 [Bacteroidota bacterium]|nr:hypothetical protein [Bacteroidota bacterium]
MKMIRFIYIALCCVGLLASCSPKPKDVTHTDSLPPLYPDYADVTIPYNIAPLNFLLRNNADAMEVKVNGQSDSIKAYGSNEICFSETAWKRLLGKEAGRKLTVRVTVRVNGQWIAYHPFTWDVVKDKLDSYLSYRLIEPGYEVWSDIRICERNIENFDERILADNNQLGNSCMNCHIYGNQKGDLTMFHLRGKDGGTILNRDGKMRKLKLKTGGMISPAVYGGFHPSGRFGVFSTNIIIPEFHSLGNKRMEVYDTASDLVVADFDANRMLTSPLISDPNVFETFPVFSADGKSIYFCSAKSVALPAEVKKLKYSLCRIAFDPVKRQFGTTVDTLVNARTTGKSVCFPRVSPDGKYILYTVADYGTFPIWHRETDLQMMNLQTGVVNPLTIVNSNRSDTYHSWSSNSRWFVFASKRDNGQYGKPYFAYVDKNGKARKPFVLPQKHPSHYDEILYSYNIPELSRSKATFKASDIEKIYAGKKAEEFR